MVQRREDVWEDRSPPDDPAALEAARAQPGGWVYDLDRVYPSDQPTPPEAIRGAWKLDAEGWITRAYAPNARYRAVEHCDRSLKPYMHAAARTNRNQWIVEIDARAESMFPEIPDDMVVGWWYVDEHGRISDQFRPNSLWIRPAN